MWRTPTPSPVRSSTSPNNTTLTPVSILRPIQHTYVLLRSSTQEYAGCHGSRIIIASEPEALHVTTSCHVACQLLQLYKRDTTNFRNDYAVCRSTYMYSPPPYSEVEGCDVTLVNRFTDAPKTTVRFRIQRVEVVHEADAFGRRV